MMLSRLPKSFLTIILQIFPGEDFCQFRHLFSLVKVLTDQYLTKVAELGKLFVQQKYNIFVFKGVYDNDHEFCELFAVVGTLCLPLRWRWLVHLVLHCTDEARNSYL